MLRGLGDKKLVHNIILIYLLQVSNYVLSFINAPYLTRALGVADYGAFSYCMSTNAYLWMLLDWGYGVGAVRSVALARTDPAKLKEAFWLTLNGRALLAAPALALLLVLAFLGRANQPAVIIASGLLTIAGGVLACDWFVAGVERMGIYLVTSVVTRAIALGLTLLLVHHPSDMWIAAMIHGLSGLMAGVAGFAVCWFLYKMGAPRLNLRKGIAEVWEFRHYFIARSNALLYVSAAPVVLGMVSSAVALGIFSGADKITRIAVTVVVPLSFAFAARVNALAATSREAASTLSGRVLLLHVFLTAPISLFLFWFATPITVLLLGDHFRSSAAVVQVLSPLPLLIGINGCLASQFLVPLGRARALSRVTVVSSVVYLLSLVALGYLAGAKGAAISFVLAESLLAVGFTGVLLLSERTYLAASFSNLLKRG